MIDALYVWLNEAFKIEDTPLRLFHFTTARMVLAFLTAFIITRIISPRIIATLYRRGVRDRARACTDGYAQSKSGTPTMGGLILIAALAGSALLWCNPTAPPIPLLLMTVLFFGGIGAIDDILKIKNGNSDDGMSRNMKLFLQGGFGVLFAVLILSAGSSPFKPEVRTLLMLPGISEQLLKPPDLGILYGVVIVLAFLLISNAINFADGLDGLAIVPACMTALVFGVYAYMFSHAATSYIVTFPHIPWMNEVTIFSAAFLGAGIGFLWYNGYPAQIFMGDTGSMMIGGTLAAMAVLTKAELLFLLAGGIFVVEFLSVFVQDYIGIRRIGRRLMFRAPFHHGFQHRGISETKVVLRFWIVSFVLAMLSIATLKLR